MSVMPSRPAHLSSTLSLEHGVRWFPREPYYLPTGNEVSRVHALPRARLAGHAQGADGMRQDAVHRAHGAQAEPPARDHRLSRRPLGQRPHRTLPHSRRGDDLGGRSAHDGGPPRRHLLPRRSRRSAAGHRRRHPSADRRPAHPADREDRRAHRSRVGLSVSDLIQPRLPARDQGSQAEHAAAVRHHRLRLPRPERRGGDHRARERSEDGRRPSRWWNWPIAFDVSRNRDCPRDRARDCSSRRRV